VSITNTILSLVMNTYYNMFWPAWPSSGNAKPPKCSAFCYTKMTNLLKYVVST